MKTQNEIVNHLGDCFKPYLKKTVINGIERGYLKDTTAEVDLWDKNCVITEDLVDEAIWVRQPLGNECKCSSLAG